jgi:hypothetical protein
MVFSASSRLPMAPSRRPRPRSILALAEVGSEVSFEEASLNSWAKPAVLASEIFASIHSSVLWSSSGRCASR